MGLTQTMGVAMRGLMASQLGLDVTGQNISNANTDGYSRKTLTLSADARYDEQFGQMGFGVEVNNIARMRDQFIDLQIQEQLTTKGHYDIVNDTLERVENIFTEPQDTGLLSYLNEFWNAWQDLANNPADPSARSVVRTKAQVLADVFHNLSGELRDLRQSRNDLIEQKVTQVNELMTEIYDLNLEITSVEITNQNANDSRDKRDELLKKLSKLIDVQVIEDKQGAVSVTTAGNLIISPAYVTKLEMTTTSFTQADGTTRRDIGVRFSDSKNSYLPLDGEIHGLIYVRDEVIPTYQDALDTLAQRIVETVNEVHRTGYDLNGFTGIDFFDSTKTTASEIDLGAAIKTNILNIAAASGGTLTDGNTVVPIGALALGTPFNLTDDDLALGTVVVTSGGITLTEGTDYVIDYDDGTIQMLNAGYAPNPAAVTVTYKYNDAGSKGPGDGSNALAIAQLRQTLTMEPNYMYDQTATFDEYYTSMIGELGIRRNEAIANVDTRQTLVNHLEKQQESIAGVSLDEEMANMIKFQHSFQAAARVISVVDQMMQTLIEIGR